MPTADNQCPGRCSRKEFIDTTCCEAVARERGKDRGRSGKAHTTTKPELATGIKHQEHAIVNGRNGTRLEPNDGGEHRQ